MSKKLSGFDRIAPFYDRLASLVFGGDILRSQNFYLSKVPKEARVLVLGGGTGQFLPALLKMNPGCQVWYIDSSAGMIAGAQRRVKNYPGLNFIPGTESAIPSEIEFDTVLTFFYLDLFEDPQLGLIIDKIKISLKKESKWIVSDFVMKDRWWAKFLLKLMYLFFQIVCGIGARRLPDWGARLTRSGFVLENKAIFFSGLIESHVYRPESV